MIVLKWISGFVFPGRRGGKASAAHNPPPLNPSISESSGLSPHENSSPAIVSETLPTCGSAGGVLPEVSGEPPNANIPLDPSTGNSGELGPPSRSLGDGKDGKSLNPSVIIRGENNTVYGAVHIARDQINNPIYNFPDTQTSPNLEDLRPLTEAHPSLLRIICGAIAFYEPPSAALLSRVLGLQEDEVRRSIEAIASHLRIQVIVAGKIKFPPSLRIQRVSFLSAAHYRGSRGHRLLVSATCNVGASAPQIRTLGLGVARLSRKRDR
ncbi:hypothetical protein MSAN_00973200 [Mycena sanguinolenta]|uniref:Uncharacterized protein n=1 Tax=Mycena sanguinolenta TaxID=230812 RepID=A0A8H7DAC0_9AGAR|nr:hypothetical protein MSAN_00973200 [Mycena sanguinolenta]